MELVGEYLTKIDEMINRQICVIKQLHCRLEVPLVLVCLA